MSSECQNSPKKSNRYSKITRLEQSNATQSYFHHGGTQNAIAEQYGVPRSTLQSWIRRRNELGEKRDPAVVAFYESPAGIAHLHCLLTAMLFIFHKMSSCGLPTIKQFLHLAQLDVFVGSSIGSLHNMSVEMDSLLQIFGVEERASLGQSMEKKELTGAGDETYFQEQMLMILMDPVSGFILAEQEEKKRDVATWQKVSEKAVEGLKVKIVQITGDAAGGLTSWAINVLGAHKSPDLFHIQQDITKSLSSMLARKVKQAEKALQESKELKQKALNTLNQKINERGSSIDNPSPQLMKAGRIAIESESSEKECQRHLDLLVLDQVEASTARQKISHIYHPFDLNTGAQRSPDDLKNGLEQSYSVLEKIAEKQGCTDNQKKRLRKSKDMIGEMVGTLLFFFLMMQKFMNRLELSMGEAILFEKFILPIAYLRLAEKRCNNREQSNAIKNTIANLENSLQNESFMWVKLPPERMEYLKQKANDCANYFQRSSSCVEGRNGAHSLKHHAARSLKARKLAGQTVIHNFFIKRRDETTAANRFFGQKHRDLFGYILDRISWPVRPRNVQKSQDEAMQNCSAA